MRRIIVLSAIAALSFLSFCGCDKENPADNGDRPQNGSNNGYQYIDLGLSVKWATFNVGATRPEELRRPLLRSISPARLPVGFLFVFLSD